MLSLHVIDVLEALLGMYQISAGAPNFDEQVAEISQARKELRQARAEAQATGGTAPVTT